MLATDEWLRVHGCEDVYALGDCATITQRKVMVCAYYTILFLHPTTRFLNIMLDH